MSRCANATPLLYSAGGRPLDNQQWTFLQNCLVARPMMQIQDVYKLLYQAQMGIGHLIQGQGDVLAYLEREIAQMAPSSLLDPLWEPVRPDGAVGRVNLRPFVSSGLDTSALADAMASFALSPPGDGAGLRADWAAVGRMVGAGSLPFGLEDYLGLTKRLEAEDYPALHHSTPYRNAYAPAYRILSRALFVAMSRSGETTGPDRSPREPCPQ